MARILLGWELGGNRGHLVRLIPVATRLAALGHAVTVAIQRIDGWPDPPPGVTICQAPVWPRLLVHTARPGGSLPATMGDILARMGLDDATTVAAMIAGWDMLLAAVDPALVVTDYAPALLCAARGRRRVLSIGSGFERVPSHLRRFPSLTGGPSAHDEDAVLDRINAGLARTGRPPLDTFPSIYATDRSITGTFAELDPYAAERQEALVAPSMAQPLPTACTGGGDEVFVYGNEDLSPDSPLWAGLARAGLTIRVHVSRASPALQSAIVAAGLIFEPQPLPFTLIAERSRLLVSNGGAGFVCSAVVAGLPQVIVHLDIEKALNGAAIMHARLGGQVPLAAIVPDAFAASLRAIHADDAMAARCRAAAPSFRARATPAFDTEVITAAVAMLR